MLFGFSILSLKAASAQDYLATRLGEQSRNSLRLVSEFGTLNRLLCIGEQAADAPSPGEESAAYWTREVRLMTPVRAFSPHIEPAGIFEVREYALLPGARDSFVAAMLDVMPMRERHSRNTGAWIPVTGDLDRIVHIWPYRDYSHRTEVRAAVAREPEWQSYLRVVLPYLRDLKSEIWKPVPGAQAACR